MGERGKKKGESRKNLREIIIADTSPRSEINPTPGADVSKCKLAAYDPWTITITDIFATSGWSVGASGSGLRLLIRQALL